MAGSDRKAQISLLNGLCVVIDDSFNKVILGDLSREHLSRDTMELGSINILVFCGEVETGYVNAL